MNIELYQRVSLARDIPDSRLKRGDVATLVDIADHPEGGEPGCVLEIFNAVGESIDVISVPMSAIEPLSSDEVLSVRHYSRAV